MLTSYGDDKNRVDFESKVNVTMVTFIKEKTFWFRSLSWKLSQSFHMAHSYWSWLDLASIVLTFTRSKVKITRVLL